MRFGICAGPAMAPAAAKAGFCYLEAGLAAISAATPAEFDRMAETVAAAGIPVEALNLMLPGAFRLTGPDACLSEIPDYLESGFARAARLGVRLQVFGSGGARRRPADWPVEKTLGQLADFLRLAAPIAARHGIAIAIEPLHPGECNVINTVSHAIALARQVSMANVGVLADWYHMALQNEGVEGVLAAGPLLLHCHIANPDGRRFPLPGDGADFSPFFHALRQIGYAGRVSVEGAGAPEEYAQTRIRLENCL